MRVTDGRVDVWEMGILNTFAKEARTGERDRMAFGIGGTEVVTEEESMGLWREPFRGNAVGAETLGVSRALIFGTLGIFFFFLALVLYVKCVWLILDLV